MTFIVDKMLGNEMPMYFNMFTLLGAHLNSAFNPIIYYYFNPQLRLGYRTFLNRLLEKPSDGKNKNKLAEMTSISTNKTSPVILKSSVPKNSSFIASTNEYSPIITELNYDAMK